MTEGFFFFKKKIFIRRFRDLGFVGFRDLGFAKFQFLIISLISFCNYSLIFLNLKYMLDIKRYLTNLK